jgi:hypothetical protein
VVKQKNIAANDKKEITNNKAESAEQCAIFMQAAESKESENST